MSLAIEENAIKMPVIALRGLVIFPEMLISFDVGRQKSAAALKYAMEHDDKEYIVATEAGILHELQRSCPDKKFYPVPPEVSEGSVGCSCNECEFMKLNTLRKIYNTLKYEWPEVNVDADIAREAVKPIERMLELS